VRNRKNKDKHVKNIMNRYNFVEKNKR